MTLSRHGLLSTGTPIAQTRVCSHGGLQATASVTGASLLQALEIAAGGADDAKLTVFHEPYRHPFQEGPHAALVQEAVDELALHQEFAHARQDAAGEIDAAL